MVWCLNPECLSPENADGIERCLSCDTPLALSSAYRKLVPLLRGHYRIIAPLGGGGFGRTYLAEDVHKFHEQCVVKQLAPQLQGSKALQKATELFAQEAKRLQELGKYPQIPTLFAYFQEGKYLFLVQELIAGEDLSQELQSQGVWDESKIRDFLSDFLPILQTVHEYKVIHRDIKPSNLMRRRSDGKLVLIDFGVSKQIEALAIGEAGTMIGTRGYAPIEQMDRGEAFPASDLYSLGATCFYLLTNISPQALWRQYGYGWVENWQSHLPEAVSPEFANILDKLLKQNYQQRYQSALAVLEDLNYLPLTEIASANFSFSSFNFLELLQRSVIAGFASSLLAIVIFSFVETVWIGASLWLLVLAGLIFTQKRRLEDKIYLFALAIITNLFAIAIFLRIREAAFFQSGLNQLFLTLLIMIVSGLLAFLIMTISRLIYKLGRWI
jgi:serine/threonine protein kinase